MVWPCLRWRHGRPGSTKLVAIRKVVVSANGDGGFAVVDIDTLRRGAQGSNFRWRGGTCKVHTRLRDGPVHTCALAS